MQMKIVTRVERKDEGTGAITEASLIRLFRDPDWGSASLIVDVPGTGEVFFGNYAEFRNHFGVMCGTIREWCNKHGAIRMKDLEDGMDNRNVAEGTVEEGPSSRRLRLAQADHAKSVEPPKDTYVALADQLRELVGKANAVAEECALAGLEVEYTDTALSLMNGGTRVVLAVEVSKKV